MSENTFDGFSLGKCCKLYFKNTAFSQVAMAGLGEITHGRLRPDLGLKG